MPVAKTAGGKPEARILPTYDLTGVDLAIADKDGTIIVMIPRIYDYQWVDRHVVLTAKANSRADLITLESKMRKAVAGGAVHPIPGGEEKFQDLTPNEDNTLHLIFRTEIKDRSNIKDGYYLLLPGFSMLGTPGTIDFFPFSMNLFWIGERRP